ncbi:coproporphyrinogen III oxidase, partial [Tannerella forsythia]
MFFNLPAKKTMIKNIILQLNPFDFLKNSIFIPFLSINCLDGIYFHVPFFAQ